MSIFKKIDWQMQLFYRGPRENAQSKTKGMIFCSTALNKDIFKKNGTLSFRVRDLFNSAMYRSETFTPTFRNNVLFRRSLPSFNLSVTYRINQKANQQKHPDQRVNVLTQSKLLQDVSTDRQSVGNSLQTVSQSTQNTSDTKRHSIKIFTNRRSLRHAPPSPQ